MQQKPEQLNGTVEVVTFQNEETGFAVLTLQDDEGELICAVGPMAGASPGEALTLAGQFVEHPSYGRQFKAEACAWRLPEGDEAVYKYLAGGVLPGIGPATARRIVDAFGGEALEVLANDPERLGTVRGFTPEKARKASRRFLELYGMREAMAMLARFGLSAAEAIAVYRQYDAQTIETVQKNPYLLCGAPLYLAFERSDAIAAHLSLEADSRERTRAAIIYTLRHNMNNGHTCLPKRRLLDTASEFFRIHPEQMEEELDLLCGEGGAQEVDYGGSAYVYLPEILRAELTAALRIRTLALQGAPADVQGNIDSMISLRETAEGIRYAPQQKQAIAEALSRRVLVITGGPGTGKTTTVNAIIALFEQQAERVFLAAPTGRAAKRLSELTGRKASTLHRLLEVDFSRGTEFAHFARNEKNPLRCDVLIVDELSMVDAMLFESMLAAMRPGCRLVLVGDTDQLPSVGPGNVLKGIIESGVVPVVALTEIFRQAAASLIVSNAHRIVQGQLPEKGTRDDDFFFLRAYGTACQKLVCDLVARRLPQSYGFSPVADIQVLCPGRRGPLGTEELNMRLQELLNPPAPGKPELRHGGVAFRLGDKVMQVKNNYDIPFTRLDGEPGAGAFNGDIGFVEEIKPSTGSMTVLCEDRHVYYTQENLNELEPAYAITIHKSQGSEFEAVVVPVAEVPSRLRYRNLLYTGVTRARQLCILAGDEEILAQMVYNGRRNLRFSCFAQFLQDEDLI